MSHRTMYRNDHFQCTPALKTSLQQIVQSRWPTVYMCGTNSAPPPLPPPQMLISWCYFKKLLNSVCEATWIRVTEWGLLSVSCLEQGSEINDIFRLGGTSLPKLPLRSPPAISGVDTSHIRFCTTALVPWVPETFLARFPVSVKSSPLVASAYGRRCVGLRPTLKIPAAREKNLWYPGYSTGRDNKAMKHKYRWIS